MKFIDQKELMSFIERSVGHSYAVTQSETKHQATVMDYLTAENFIVTKVMAATKRGASDVWAGSDAGQLWLIEVKREDGVLSAIQEAKLIRAYQNKVVAMVAYGYEDFKRKYKRLTS